MKIRAIDNKHGHPSCIAEYGDTQVLCSASYDHSVPKFLDPVAQGWISAEYNMLPHSTHTRCSRTTTKPKGRSIEIQRLISRCLRAACNLQAMPGLNINIDCDVLQADAGTRVASINGGFVCLARLITKLLSEKIILKSPIVHHICALSCCIIDGKAVFHPTYNVDSQADTDINLVFTHTKKVLEIQASGEKGPIAITSWSNFIDTAFEHTADIIHHQKQSILQKC